MLIQKKEIKICIFQLIIKHIFSHFMANLRIRWLNIIRFQVVIFSVL